MFVLYFIYYVIGFNCFNGFGVGVYELLPLFFFYLLFYLFAYLFFLVINVFKLVSLFVCMFAS